MSVKSKKKSDWRRKDKDSGNKIGLMKWKLKEIKN